MLQERNSSSSILECYGAARLHRHVKTACKPRQVLWLRVERDVTKRNRLFHVMADPRGGLCGHGVLSPGTALFPRGLSKLMSSRTKHEALLVRFVFPSSRRVCSCLAPVIVLGRLTDRATPSMMDDLAVSEICISPA